MKKNLFYGLLVVLLISTAVFIYGCGSSATGGGSSSSGGGASMISVTGHITTDSSYFTSVFKPTIKKVVIFNCNGGYWIANVSNGVFTGEAEAGRPIGMIFAGSTNTDTTGSNNFLGYMRMGTTGSSLDSIPLNLVDSISKEVDLKTIRLLSGVATTEKDLIKEKKDDLTINNDDINAMAFANETFSNLIKHPDADQDGKIDILETGKYYRPFIMYFIYGGTFEGSSAVTPTVISSEAVFTQYKFCLDAYDPTDNFPSEITFSNLGLTVNSGTSVGQDKNTSITHRKLWGCVHSSSDPKIPDDDIYNVQYSTLSKDLSFEVSGQADATRYIALAVPTASLDAFGKIKKVSWTYNVAGGTGATIEASALISDLIVQLQGSGGRIEDSPNFSPTVHDWSPSKSIAWSDVDTIFMAYNDFFGNHVVVEWHKQ